MEVTSNEMCSFNNSRQISLRNQCMSYNIKTSTPSSNSNKQSQQGLPDRPSPSKKIIKSVSSNKIKNKSPFYKYNEKDRMKEAINMYLAYVKNNNFPPQQSTIPNLNKKASERKVTAQTIGNIQKTFDDRTLTKKLKQPLKNFDNLDQLRKFLSNEIHSKVNSKHDSLIDKYSRWRLNENFNDKLSQFSSAAEIQSQPNDQRVVAQVKHLFPSIYSQSRNTIATGGDNLSSEQQEKILKVSQFNSILFSNSKEFIQEQSGLNDEINQSMIIQEQHDSFLGDQTVIDNESKIVFKIKKKKRNSRKNNNSQLSNISSRGGRNQSLEYPQNHVYSNLVQIQKLQDNKILPALNISKFHESPHGKKNKEILEKTDQNIFQKQHQITKEGFFSKSNQRQNHTINFEQELQDKKFMNKLKLIQKHNEGLQDLINIPVSPNKLKSQRQNLHSPHIGEFDLKLKLIGSESQVSLNLPELDQTKKVKVYEKMPQSKSQMQAQNQKNPIKIKQNQIVIKQPAHLSQSQSLDVILSARNAKNIMIDNNNRQVQEQLIGDQPQVFLVNKIETFDLTKTTPIKTKKANTNLKRDLSTQRQMPSSLNMELQKPSSNQTSYQYSRKNVTNLMDSNSLKNKFKQLMRFSTNEDLEQIEFEMQILDKLLEQKSQLNKQRNGILPMYNGKNQEDDQSNTKRGKVVFNLSKNETTFIYKEE